jgi:hypothetical protein
MIIQADGKRYQSVGWLVAALYWMDLKINEIWQGRETYMRAQKLPIIIAFPPNLTIE